MVTEINTIEDVKQFAQDLTLLGVVFHCDDDFNDYIDLESKERSFTNTEAERLNSLMSKCFEVCETAKLDIYEVMNTENIIDKLIQEKQSKNK